MSAARLLAFCCCLFVGLSTVMAGEPDKKEAELQWAKEVVADFLNAGFQKNYPSAEALATEEFKTTLKETGPSSVSFLLIEYVASPGATAWEITEEVIAPDQDEALFRGVFQAETKQAPFSLRVIKEKASGKWRVNFFAAGEYREPKEQE